ncbi:hypothetical protein EGM51_04365 [Verrucomicrobia bacterium S94]|nr:hypothetical protein EGM51_04365 [Verrucomicrobia bacterium S94]
MKQDPSIGSGCWYLGQIYINPSDRRIIIRRRSRIGWTINLARPLAIPVFLLICVYALAPFYLLDCYAIDNPWAYFAAFVFVLISLMAFCLSAEKKFAE